MDTIPFETTSARHGLPLLVAGQTQKEFFVNEAFARIDSLLHPVVEGIAAAPPAAPVSGECWVVGNPATSTWQGREEELAGWDGEQWTFCTPSPGMLIFDRQAGRRMCYLSGWKSALPLQKPAGGAIVDTEARAAIEQIIDLFATLAIIPAE